MADSFVQPTISDHDGMASCQQQLLKKQMQEEAAWELRTAALAARATYEREGAIYSQAENDAARRANFKKADILELEAKVLRQRHGETLTQTKEFENLRRDEAMACKEKKEMRKRKKKLKAEVGEADARLLDALMEIQLLGHVQRGEARAAVTTLQPSTRLVKDGFQNIVRPPEYEGQSPNQRAVSKVPDITGHPGSRSEREGLVGGPTREQVTLNTPSSSPMQSRSLEKSARPSTYASDEPVNHDCSGFGDTGRMPDFTTNPSLASPSSGNITGLSVSSRSSGDTTVQSADFARPVNLAKSGSLHRTSSAGTSLPKVTSAPKFAEASPRPIVNKAVERATGNQQPPGDDLAMSVVSNYRLHSPQPQDTDSISHIGTSSPPPPELSVDQQADVAAKRDADIITATQELQNRELQYWNTKEELDNHGETYADQYAEFFNDNPDKSVDFCKDAFGPMYFQKGVLISRKLAKAEQAMKAARIEARRVGVEQPNSHDQESGFLTEAGEGEGPTKVNAQYSINTCDRKRIREWIEEPNKTSKFDVEEVQYALSGAEVEPWESSSSRGEPNKRKKIETEAENSRRKRRKFESMSSYMLPWPIDANGGESSQGNVDEPETNYKGQEDSEPVNAHDDSGARSGGIEADSQVPPMQRRGRPRSRSVPNRQKRAASWSSSPDGYAGYQFDFVHPVMMRFPDRPRGKVSRPASHS